MSTLLEKEETTLEAAVHLLLIGKSKAGKTHMVADLILDGATVLYVDNDNGLNTLRRRLSDNAEALGRCHYIATTNLYSFLTYFFARKSLLWNETRDEIYSSTHAGTDKVTEIKITQIPFGVVLAFDSWTSASNGLLLDAATKNGVTLETFNNAGEAAYGDALRRANNLLGLIQRSPHHVIMQAHEDHYERYEKPPGSINAKRKDMILKENIKIPMSTSRPHGFQMVKYFNESGWLDIDPIGNFQIDYRQQRDRVGGGSLMKVGSPTKELRLSKTLFPIIPNGNDWIRTITVEQYKAEQPAKPAPSEPTKTTATESEMLPSVGTLKFKLPIK